MHPQLGGTECWCCLGGWITSAESTKLPGATVDATPRRVPGPGQHTARRGRVAMIPGQTAGTAERRPLRQPSRIHADSDRVLLTPKRERISTGSGFDVLKKIPFVKHVFFGEMRVRKGGERIAQEVSASLLKLFSHYSPAGLLFIAVMAPPPPPAPASHNPAAPPLEMGTLVQVEPSPTRAFCGFVHLSLCATVSVPVAYAQELQPQSPMNRCMGLR